MNAQRSAYEKDRHAQLMALLSDHHSGLMNIQLQNSALLLVALGWLASSKEMQVLLRGNIILPSAVNHRGPRPCLHLLCVGASHLCRMFPNHNRAQSIGLHASESF